MKKITVLLLAMIISFTSCKKENAKVCGVITEVNITGTVGYQESYTTVVAYTYMVGDVGFTKVFLKRGYQWIDVCHKGDQYCEE